MKISTTRILTLAFVATALVVIDSAIGKTTVCVTIARDEPFQGCFTCNCSGEIWPRCRTRSHKRCELLSDWDAKRIVLMGGYLKGFSHDGAAKSNDDDEDGEPATPIKATPTEHQATPTETPKSRQHKVKDGRRRYET